MDDIFFKVILNILIQKFNICEQFMDLDKNFIMIKKLFFFVESSATNAKNYNFKHVGQKKSDFFSLDMKEHGKSSGRKHSKLQ